MYIINSAPGVGKSTLLKSLHSMLPDGFAILDGDDLGRVTPYRNDTNWLNAIQDNLVGCCVNFRSYGYTRCIAGFVFPAEERLNRITGMLIGEGFKVMHILLDCGEAEIERRITQRNTSRIINVQQAQALSHQMKQLAADCRIDTTDISSQEVANAVYASVTGG